MNERNLKINSKSWENNEDDCNIRIEIGVIEFCRKMCLVAGNFYDKNFGTRYFYQYYYF